MGLKCIQSIGEAEALCAALNEKGVSPVLLNVLMHVSCERSYSLVLITDGLWLHQPR